MKSVKLSEDYCSEISEDLLRSFAVETLGAKRCSKGYLKALRVILGNQAMADRRGVELDINHRVPFATEQTMRTLIGQFNKAQITCKRTRVASAAHSQVVTCYRGKFGWRMGAEEECIQRQRRIEGEAFRQYMIFHGITETDLPY